SVSVLRLYNSSTTSGSINIRLINPSTGAAYRSMTRTIAAGTMQQFPVSEVEGTSTDIGSYSVIIEPGFTGFFQHLAYNYETTAFSNMTTCASGLVPQLTTVAGVISSAFANTWQSYLVLNNPTTTTRTPFLRLYSISTGNQLGSGYAASALPANG